MAVLRMAAAAASSLSVRYICHPRWDKGGWEGVGRSFLSDAMSKCQTYSLRVLYLLQPFVNSAQNTFEEWI